MNLSPFASKFIWSFVSSLSERFLICFLFASIFVRSFLLFDFFALFALFVCYAGFRSFSNGPMFVVGGREDTCVLFNLFIRSAS